MLAKVAKKKVHIYSTYGTRCGIAAFAATIEDLLAEKAEFSFCVLDPFLFRSRLRHVMERSDKILLADEAQVAACDVVNLQFEPGILGVAPSTIVKRLDIILKHVKKHRKPLVVTNHTVFSSPRDFSFLLNVTSKGYLKPRQVIHQAVTGRLSMPRKIYQMLAEIDRLGLLTMIVHNRRDRRYLNEVWNFRHVVDHPLQHLRTGWDQACREEAQRIRHQFAQRFGKDKTIIGAFGFLADYKGFDIAIRALRHLDERYLLLIYGGIHPNTVVEGEPINSYLATLMEEVEGRSKRSDAAARRLRTVSSALTATNSAAALLSEQIDQMKSLTSRVHFMGSPDEFEFASAIGACDVCIFPYREVEQSASGPMCYAIELEKPIVASSTGAFRELSRYFPGRLEYIDIGNHLQLAAAIGHLSSPREAPPSLAYTHRTMADFYDRHLLSEGQPA